MIIKLDKKITPKQKQALLEKLKESPCETRNLQGKNFPHLGILGKLNITKEDLLKFEGVLDVIQVTTPFKLASRQMHPEDTHVQVGNAVVGGENIAVIAGPCAVESHEQVMTIAAAVRKAGAIIFRGGAFKPRTSPYSFQGMEEEGLKILAEARETYGLPVVTEMTSPSQAELMMKYVDMVQVGARNMQNFELLKCVGRMNKPVLLKRGLSGTIEEWLMSAEYILSEGNKNIVLCERGIRTFEPYTRNTLDMSAIPVLRNLTHLPIVVDPSHATGMREKVAPMARSAIAAGADGLMIEVHHDPDHAFSDGPQSLYPQQFRQLMRDIYVIAPVIGKQVDFDYLEKAGKVARNIQKGMKTQIAFVGRIGSFSHKACVQYFGDKVEAVSVTSFGAVFDSVQNGEAEYGIIPLENSLTGSIHENYDLLQEYDLHIISELKLRIIHSLMVKPGNRLDHIQRVYSHPQVFEQSRQFLQQHGWEQIAVNDIADAANRVLNAEDKKGAFIGDRIAGEKYGLAVLEEGIETNPRNYTRFVVISREPAEKQEITKTSLIVSAPNEPGALFSILKSFTENKVNMIKLESRPIPGEPWKYMFYIDIEEDIESPEYAPMLKDLQEKTDYMKIVGRY